jgi:hypothetical protein
MSALQIGRAAVRRDARRELLELLGWACRGLAGCHKCELGGDSRFNRRIPMMKIVFGSLDPISAQDGRRWFAHSGYLAQTN